MAPAFQLSLCGFVAKARDRSQLLNYCNLEEQSLNSWPMIGQSSIKIINVSTDYVEAYRCAEMKVRKSKVVWWWWGESFF